jgi:chromatin structure-remodeling complex subunit RSC1/2
MPASGTNVYNPPRAPEIYTLPAAMDNAIPPSVRERFHTDDQGRVLFYTAPPAQRPNDGVAPEYAGLAHSTRYLNGLSEFRAERARKRKERDEALAEEARKQSAKEKTDREEAQREMGELTQLAVQRFVEHMDDNARAAKQALGGWDLKATKAAGKA